jgi:hypothetical protein
MRQVLICIFLIISLNYADAQGCVAIRSNGASCTMDGAHSEVTLNTPDRWLFSVNTRYFKSYKHFVGREEQKERKEAGTEVINYTVSTELGLNRKLNNRWALGLFVPVINNVRSSLYEHYGNASESPNARNKTRSFGLGDMRVAAYYWVLDPAKVSKGNIQLGAGLKLPTGEYRYQDYFYKNDTTKVLGPVDQSIQLGDGGTGITTEYNAFYRVTSVWSVYSNGFYLFNPREHNGVSTARGGTPAATAIAYGSDVMSVPDQFMFRTGVNYSFKRLHVSGGMRIEGVPASDIIGGSNGFRRPGYVLSVEPVLAYSVKKTQLYISVPYAIERNRTQSVPDKKRTQLTGVYAQGDAAFADYSINIGAAFLLK